MTGWIVFLCAMLVPEGKATIVMDSGQAQAVLAIVETVKLGRTVSDDTWSRLFNSEGYRRLKRREAAMKRDFTDDDFRAFVTSPELAENSQSLAHTLERWQQIHLGDIAATVEAYLPPGPPIRCTVYLVIKPQTNSFVFETTSANPAIFLYVDPDIGPANLANTIAHEFHHIGFANRCGDGPDELPPALGHAVRWTYALGEGLAMLAAAGDPWTHPHRDSKPEDRQRWDADIEAFDTHLAALDDFFSQVLSGQLDGNAIMAQARTFYGIQGPWYTVGWQMAAQLERHHGRDYLLDRLCRPWTLIPAYNQWATQRNQEGETWPLWSPVVVDAFATLEMKP